MRFCSVGSGSRGNSYILKSKDAAVVIDAGISRKRILDALSCIGAEPDDVTAVLITHEHEDHIKSTASLLKKCTNAKAFMSLGTWQARRKPIPEDRIVIVEAEQTVDLDGINITPFELHHDAEEPLGFSVSAEGKNVTVVTDTGFICENIYGHIKNADLLVVEANHDEDILRMGSYPYDLKLRILGDSGHISNKTAGECICRLVTEQPERERQVMLAHMSRENNTVEIAMLTVVEMLKDKCYGYEKRLDIHMAVQDERSEIFEV